MLRIKKFFNFLASISCFLGFFFSYLSPALPQVLTCPEHDQEKLQFYCRSCQRLLCPLCKLRRIHTGHKILPVAQAHQALKVGLRSDWNMNSVDFGAEFTVLSHHDFCFVFKGKNYKGDELHSVEPGHSSVSDHSAGEFHHTD